MAEQGTHKPLVGSSNLPLATGVNHDQQLPESREVVGHFAVCDKGLRRRFVAKVLTIEGTVKVWQGTPKNEVSRTGVMLDLAWGHRLERGTHVTREGMDRRESGHSCRRTGKTVLGS